MTLRAHWNFLGVTTLSGIGIDRYLMETWAIVAGALPSLLLVLLIAVLAMIAIRIFNRFAPAIARRTVPPLLGALPWIVVLLLMASQFRMAQVFSRGGSDCSIDIALGDLQRRDRSGCFAQPDESVLFYGTTVLCIAALLLRGRVAKPQKQQVVWSAGAAIAIVVALQLPILYGRTLKPPTYPAASITMTNGQLNGLLVLQTGDAVELWTVQNAHGQMLIIPMGQVQSIRAGALRNLFTVAHETVHGTVFEQALGLSP